MSGENVGLLRHRARHDHAPVVITILTFVSADLTITPATLIVTAGNLDINHGDSIPTPGYTVTGFVRDDTQAVLSGAPSFSTPR